MSSHQPLRVTAQLAAGVAQSAPWGISLDGLLASQLWARLKPTASAQPGYVRALQRDDVADLELPLARCTPEAGPWHWAATCAWPDVQERTDVRTWTSRVDRRDLEAVAVALPLTVSARQGRYRTRHMPLLVSVCSTLTWHAVGDPEPIADLLDDVVTIGKKRTSGDGHVLRWLVEPAPELDQLTAGHLHPDGTLGRPTPQACVDRLQPVKDGGLGTAGIRPPYMHRSRQHQLHLPALLGS